MSAFSRDDTAARGPREAGTAPRPVAAATPPAAAVARQVVREVRHRIADLVASRMDKGELVAGIGALLTAVETSPLAWLAAQQRAETRRDLPDDGPLLVHDGRRPMRGSTRW